MLIILKLGHAEFLVRDLDWMVEFNKTPIGLPETGRKKDTIYLSTSVDHHSIETRRSPKQKTPGVVATGFCQCGATTQSEKREYPVDKAPLIRFAGLLPKPAAPSLYLSRLTITDIRMFRFTFEYRQPKLVPTGCFSAGSEESDVMRNEDTEPVSIVGISGSLRKASFSTNILRVLARESTPAIDFNLVTLEEIPLYNEDLDREPGIPAVNTLKQLISSCDGILISTPEYNHGIPGVLKNALDWVSRPAFESCFKDKPVSIISCSKAFTGGVRAQYQLRETLVSMHAQLVMGPEVVVGGVHRNFRDESYTDEAGLALMLKVLNRLRDTALCQLKQMEPEMLTDGETRIIYVDSLAQATAVHDLSPKDNHDQARAKPISPLPQAVLRRVKEYIEEHLHDKLSLNELARKTSYSRAHFLRMFRAATGTTPHQYLTERRIEQAKRILQEEDISLIDTASRCGFSNQSHMTRVFREQVGLPPSAFRRRP